MGKPFRPSPYPRLVYRFEADMWVYQGEGPWHFITLPALVAEEIDAEFAGLKRPFGSLSVEATVGVTTWATSIFKDSKSGSYLLPVKKSVRMAERVVEGDRLAVELKVNTGSR